MLKTDDMVLLVLIIITCSVIAILLVRLARAEKGELIERHKKGEQEALISAALKERDGFGLFQALFFGSLPSKEAKIARILAFLVILFVSLFLLFIAYVFVTRS